MKNGSAGKINIFGFIFKLFVIT